MLQEVIFEKYYPPYFVGLFRRKLQDHHDGYDISRLRGHARNHLHTQIRQPSQGDLFGLYLLLMLIYMQNRIFEMKLE